MMDVCAILLAAGTSSRMGRPKPLLQWGETTLLEHQVQQLRKLSFSEIIVVLGHKREMILKTIEVEDPQVKLLECRNYREGLSSSLKCGLEQASKKHDAVMIMLVGLPLIRLETIKRITDTGVHLLSTASKPFVVQPRYQNQNGHPVFLGWFNRLNWQDLRGDTGAKPLIQQLNHHILLDSDDAGVIFDVDTPEAYKKALSNAIFKR